MHHSVCALVLLHLVFFVCFVFVVLLLFFKGGLLSFPAQDNVTLGIGSFAWFTDQSNPYSPYSCRDRGECKPCCLHTVCTCRLNASCAGNHEVAFLKRTQLWGHSLWMWVCRTGRTVCACKKQIKFYVRTVWGKLSFSHLEHLRWT